MRIKSLLPAFGAAISVFTFAADAPSSAAITTSQDTTPPPDTVLVKKGDVVVTAGDFLASLEKLPADQRFTFRADVDRITNAVSSIYVMRSLANDARAKGIDKDPDVQRRVRLAEEAVLAQVDMERYEKSIVAPDYEARAREIYKSSPERFERPPTIEARRIVVGLQGRTDEEAKRRAQEALDKLRAGEPIAVVTREYSTDPNLRNNNGIVRGYYSLMPDEVAKVARTAPLNQPVGPIRTAFSYEVLVVNERLPGYTIPFDKAKGDIIDTEQAKYRKAQVDERLGSITKDKAIEIHTDEIAALKTDIDRTAIHEAHVERQRRNEEEKAKLLEKEAKKGKTD